MLSSSLNYQELFLSEAPRSKPPSYLLFSQKVLPQDQKPFFSYTQAAAFKDFWLQFSIEANLLSLRVYSHTKNNMPSISLEFDENISGRLLLGALGGRPYLLVPLINGVVFIIDLNGILSGAKDMPLNSMFSLDISNSLLLSLDSLSELVKDSEKAWNLVLVAACSNGSLRSFESSINLEKMLSPSKETLGDTQALSQQPMLPAVQEVKVFYSGLIGKLRNYSDYYLRNSVDSILTAQYFSGYVMIIVTRQFIVKFVSVSSKHVLFEGQMEEFLTGNDQDPGAGYPIVKIQTLPCDPRRQNDDEGVYFTVAVAELDNQTRNFIKLMSFCLGGKKPLKKNPLEFEFSRNLKEEITGSFELVESQTVRLPNKGTVKDFSLSQEGLLIASSANDGASDIHYLSFSDSQGIRLRQVASLDSSRQELATEDTEFQELCPKELLIERLFLTKRFSKGTLQEYFNFDERTTRDSEMDRFSKYSNEDLGKIAKELEGRETERNSVQTILNDKNQGFPVIFRRNSLSALRSLSLFEEIAIKLDNSRLSFDKPQFIGHLCRLARSFPEDLGLLPEDTSAVLQSLFLINGALRIVPDLLRTSFETGNPSNKSFNGFMEEHVHKLLSQLDGGSIKAFEGSFAKNDTTFSVFLKEYLDYITTRAQDPKLEKQQVLFNQSGTGLLAFYSEGLKAGIRSHAGFSVALLVGLKAYQRIMGKHSPELSFQVEALSKITQILLSVGDILRQPYRGTTGNNMERANWGDWDMDLANLWTHERCWEICSKVPKNKQMVGVAEQKVLAACLALEAPLDKLDINYIPGILNFCHDIVDSRNFLRLQRSLGIRNPSIEFLRLLITAKIAETDQKSRESFTKGINYVASFVNLTTLNRTSGVEKRTPLCLGPWFVHQTLEIEKLGGSNNPVKLQTMILQNFFKGMKVVRGLVSRTALKFEGQNINNKLEFLQELAFHKLTINDLEAATNVFLSGLDTLFSREFGKQPHFLIEFLKELQKSHDINLFFSRLPLAPETLPRIESLALIHTDFCFDSLKKDLQNSQSNFYQLFDGFTRELPLIPLLVTGYTAKGSYTEAIDLLFYQFRKLVAIATISVPLSRDCYLNILSLIQSSLTSLCSISSLKPNQLPLLNPPCALNEPIDLSVLLTNRKDILLPIDSFRRFLKKIEALQLIVEKNEGFESQNQFPIDMPIEQIIRYLVKNQNLEAAVNLAVISQADATGLLIYLSEVYSRLNEGNMVYGEYSLENVLDLIDQVIKGADKDKKRGYLKTVAEKILRYNIQKNREDEELPAGLFEQFRRIDPNGLVLLYLKYHKNTEAGAVVLNYVKEKMVIGNRRMAGQQVADPEDYLPPNVIVTVIDAEGNEKVKEEFDRLLDNVNE